MPNNLQFEKPSGKTVEYLEKYFTSPSKPGYITCGGTLFPQSFTQIGNRILKMNVRSDDVWVCSFPRTGTTLTQEMVWCIANNVDLKMAEKSLFERFPLVEASIYNPVDSSHLQNDPEILDLWPDYVELVTNLPSPRFIKSHLPFKLLPEELQQNNRKAKIIYVTRNPCDTCISFFHHSRKYADYSGNFEQFCELFIDGNVPYGPFWSHVQSYWTHHHEKNILLLKYEDMINDLGSVINKTANFLEKSLCEEQVTKLINHLSFEKMKENPAVNLKSYDERMQKCGEIPEKHEDFIRSGKVGEWKEIMDAKLIQRFETWQQENLKNSDASLTDFFIHRT